MRARTDLGLVVALTFLSAVAAAVFPSSLTVLRAILALPLVLALPGYAVTAAVFAPRELRSSELVLLSATLSIAATIFSALLLAAFGIALDAAPWMALLAVVTLAATAVAFARGCERPLPVLRLGLGSRELLAVAGAVVLLAGAAALGFSPLGPPKGIQGASALWILPQPDGRGGACVGVINDEAATTTYTVSVSVAGGAPLTFGPIRLVPGGTWSRAVTAPGKPAITASLRRSSNPSVVYAQVYLRSWNIKSVAC